MTIGVHATILRVSGAGNNSDGSSWANGYQTIQAALNVAVSGDEIWVKQGTYIIYNDLEQLNYKEGVNIYGGFVGDEMTISQRNTNAALTIISHDENGAGNFRLLNSSVLNMPTLWDGFTFDGKNKGTGVRLSSNCNLNNVIVKNCVISDGSGPGVSIESSEKIFGTVSLTNSIIKDNTLSVNGVPYLGGGAGVYVSPLSTAALIDNCVISGNTINAIATAASVFVFGAGVLIHEGVIRNSTIDNNKVIGNAAQNFITGGGIAIRPMNAERNVLIEGCSITNNSSAARGGAVIIDPVYGGQFLGNYTILNSKIINNKSNNVGSGIFTSSSTRQDEGWTLNVINSVIANNTALTGGGIYINASGNVNITYSTIVNNVSTGTFGGGGIMFQGASSQTINAAISNVLIWGNTQSGTLEGRTQFNNNKQASTIRYSAIQDYDESFNGWDSSITESIINLSSDNASGPKFLAPTATVGYGASDLDASRWQITEGSMCIEGGIYATDNNGNQILTDIAGKARPIVDDFVYPDIGAYQFDAANPPLLGIKAITKLESEVKIYPTVANSLLNVKTNKAIKQIEIFNIHGIKVLETKAIEIIDVSNFTSGMYLFRAVFEDNMTSVKRFIKK